ncbi:MAG: bifunctional glutamate N-acetyltransferase/amino-acid acetyltransferase ArgJ [Shimia sp.]|nr:bifunctional glutamate N-acetyltransferase/amino-acid acetyltransferase ArgJ [Shimia sp.]
MAKIEQVSPLAPERFPDLPAIKGASFSAVEAGVKYSGRKDVMLAVLQPGSVVAGVFTKSATRSAAVLDCQAKIDSDDPAGAAILVNAGNANAFTGSNGESSVRAVAQAVSACTRLPENRVFTSSTGVIGEPLPHDRITAKLDNLRDNLSETCMEDAAEAIRTTDTFAKGASKSVTIRGRTVKIAGIAKGSGMIAPDMATMLVYIFTDAKLSREELQTLVSDLNEVTFNAITVDSDTSTSDTLLVAATGASQVEVSSASEDFRTALHDVMRDLAHQVVRDGEGATKFVEVKVTGAASKSDARIHASAIANSPLVKTAIAGEDPNWGRVVMAIGKSGAAADRDLLSIRFGDVLVAQNGWVAPSYKEEDGAAYMKRQNIVVHVDLGLGNAEDTMWTCDLTHGYITINADYRS